VANVARPDTILAWYRKLVARKFDGSKARRGPGRPRVDRALEQLIVRMAEENRDWGYDRIVGALANLGYEISDQSVGNILRRQKRDSLATNRAAHYRACPAGCMIEESHRGADRSSLVVREKAGSLRPRRRLEHHCIRLKSA